MLVFNSHTTSQDIVSEVLRRSQAFTVDNFPLVDIARIANFGLDWYYGIAFSMGKGWNYDDVNETSPPIDTQNIVSGNNRYKLGAFTEKVVGNIKIELLDEDANGVFLDVDTMEDLKDNRETFQEKYVDAGSGKPSKYIKYGDFIYLDKKPDYSESDGLLVYFNRPAEHFASTDTTKTAGIAELHAEVLCEYIAQRWKLDNDLISKNEFNDSILMIKNQVSTYFGLIRSQDKEPIMRVRQESNK